MTEAFAVLQRKAQERWRELNSHPWVRVGTALCGQAAGALDTLEALRAELTRQRVEATVSQVGCLGLCYAEPLVDVQLPGGPRVLYQRVTPDQVPDVVQGHLVHGEPRRELALAAVEGSVDGVPRLSDLPMFQGQVRIALRNAGHIDPTDLDHYIARGGFEALDLALSKMSPQQVHQHVMNSKLRGRGGAAFPTGVKWRFLMGAPGPKKYILCNCEEGDPGAFNDKGILESDPFTVLEGMVLAGYATGATNGFVFIRHGHEGPIERTRRAIQACYQAGLLGSHILGSSFSFDIEVSLTGESYVAGEETALMESIEGKRSMPRFRPPFPAQVGVWGRPSNINNVKTLAYVPEIVRLEGEWFSRIGMQNSTGTAIICLSGDVARPGMVEVPFGLTLRQVVEEMAGGVPDGKRLKLLQTGGPLGGVLSGELLDTIIDFDEMARAGAILGSGGVIVASEDSCAVDLTRNLIAFCQLESCGKCFPCRLGMSHILEVLERICRLKGRPGDLDLMRRVGQNMQVGSLCGHGQLGFNPVSSALKFFGEEFRVHIEEKRCPTGRCQGPFVGPERTRRWAHLHGESPTAAVYPEFVANVGKV
ncbi:MAG: SLBB domain-containing protein [Chloroflexi bacterium]|nr:SLBB domain-containing protein [Chloroflexota bacterium]